MTCLFVSTQTPTLPFHSCSQKPQGSTTDEVMDGISESLCDRVFALYSTLSGDHMHRYCNGTLILILLPVHWTKVGVKHVVIQTSHHFERFVGCWDLYYLKFGLESFNTAVNHHGQVFGNEICTGCDDATDMVSSFTSRAVESSWVMLLCFSTGQLHICMEWTLFFQQDCTGYAYLV